MPLNQLTISTRGATTGPAQSSVAVVSPLHPFKRSKRHIEALEQSEEVYKTHFHKKPLDFNWFSLGKAADSVCDGVAPGSFYDQECHIDRIHMGSMILTDIELSTHQELILGGRRWPGDHYRR